MSQYDNREVTGWSIGLVMLGYLVMVVAGIVFLIVNIGGK